MNRQKLCDYFLSSSLTFLMAFSHCSLSVLANSDVYNEPYNIHTAISYADEYTDEEGDYNQLYGFYVECGDCTNFVSQCISVAVGLPQQIGHPPVHENILK